MVPNCKKEIKIASTTEVGGIKVGTNLSIDSDGKLSSTDTTYNIATTSANGLMTKEMVTKLNGIATGANKYILPKASATVLGGIKARLDGTTLYLTNDGTNP